MLTRQFYPCLGITLGVALSASQQRLQGVPTPTDFHLRELHGELRLSELTDAAGPASLDRESAAAREIGWPRNSDYDVLRSWTSYGSRGSKLGATGSHHDFGFQLWPSLVGKDELYDAEIRGFTAEIPQQAWLDILAKWGSGRWSILEVPYSAVDEERFTAALGYLAKATHWLDTGEYDEAVWAACRLAIDAMFKDLSEDGKKKRCSQPI